MTAQVVEMAHAVGVSVEGELGCLGSLESGMAGEEDGVGAEGKLTHDQLLTDPDQCADFVARTGVDALAIAIGTSHGAYKFSRRPTGDILAVEMLAMQEQLPVDRHGRWKCWQCRSNCQWTATDGGNAGNAGAIASEPPWSAETLDMQEQLPADCHGRWKCWQCRSNCQQTAMDTSG